MSAGKALESDFDKWQKSKGGFGDLVWLSLDANTRTVNFLLEGMDEFSITYPPNYPQDEKARFSLTASAKSLAPWVQNVNAWLQNQSKLSIADVLSKSLEMKKNAPRASPSSEKPPALKKAITRESSDDEIEDDDAEDADVGDASDEVDGGVGDDKGGDFDLESEELKESLEILRLKKRWAKKEATLREEMRRKRDKEVKNKDKAKVEQIFSTQAASGVLTNDLLSIMDNSEALGFTANPIDDNIYHWNVKLFKFKPDTEVGKQLRELKRLYGYDYVEIEVMFTIDLYPFYPPQVKVVRPRFQGFMMGRITSMELLKLSYWDPVKDMKFVLNEIRNLIHEHGKVDVNNPQNNPKEYPKGSYTELEYLLLRLELLCETDPRANLKYPMQYQQQPVAKPKPNAAALAAAAAVATPGAPSPSSHHQKGADGTFWAKGTGYGFSGQNTWDVNAYLAAQREKDMQTEHVLRGILDFLTGPSKVTDSSCEVIEESCLLPVLEGYLRNDSLLDIGKHATLYIVIFGLLRALTSHENTVSLLDKLAFQKDSLADLLAVLAKQAALFLKHARASAGSDAAGVQAVALAEDIMKTGQTVESALAKLRAEVKAMEQALGSTSSAVANAPADVDLADIKAMDVVYSKLMKPLQFDSCSMKKGGAYLHHYSAQLKNTQAPKEKILRLAQEQGTLSTSLPISHESSVFLRIDEDRMDLMQAIITGPIDTPYSGGCFTFHIFFPDTYPNSPPLVNLETTGGGTIRFNPNLYNCGKVCLSLLGT